MTDSLRSTLAVRPIAVALDAPDVATAAEWAGEVAPHVSTLKLGLEFYLAAGAEGVRQVRSAAPDCRLFLDLKLHDIPNTVAGACRAVADLEPDFLTVHALGGAGDGGGGRRGASRDAHHRGDRADLDGPGRPRVLSGSVARRGTRCCGWPRWPSARAPGRWSARRRRSPRCGRRSGATSSSSRQASGRRGAALGDQQRVATPEQALADGADLLVVGRPITGAPDRAAAAAELLAIGTLTRPVEPLWRRHGE